MPWFIVFFVAMWFGVTGLLAVFSGWTGLAAYWRAQRPLTGERFRIASASMGAKLLPVGYSNCLSVTVSDQGLGVSILLPFRFLCPPLFIPWSDVANVTEGRLLFFRYVVVRPVNHWSRIKLYGRVVERVLVASSGRTRVSDRADP